MPEATSSIHKTGCFPAWQTTQRDSQYTADGEHMDCQFFYSFFIRGFECWARTIFPAWEA